MIKLPLKQSFVSLNKRVSIIKTLFLIFILCASSNVHAQFDDMNVSVYFNYKGGVLKNPTFTKFASSYNNYQTSNGVEIKHGLQNEPFASGYQFGIKIYIFSLNYLRVSSRHFSESANGNKLYFKKVISTPLNFGIPFLIKDVISVHPRFGLGTSYLESYFKYSDGTISRGNETPFPGIYRAYIPSFYYGIDLGGRFNISDNHALEFGISFDKFFGFNADYRNDDEARFNSLFTSDKEPTWLPEDVEEFFRLGNLDYSLEGNSYVRAKNSFFGFYISYHYIFND
ncbi:MAG: hypothetical protein CVU05_13970 [Bacteroidetes bacterium HGW-Bacteroidetes-21]|jgi:hypothetical protein|nr:MAG: hypothetical protein CVU05_13970 [Bacteroidetes bacterium HGW-Bacteroidetes-21]